MFGKIKVAQLREFLKAKGLDEDTLNDMGKGELTLEVLNRNFTAEDVLDFNPNEDDSLEVIYDDEVSSVKETEKSNLPKYGSNEWNDYVVSLLTEDEKENGYPTLVGLRRLGSELLGEVISSGPSKMEVQHFGPDDSPQVSCVYALSISWIHGIPEYVDIDKYQYPIKTFSACAGCTTLNTDSKFAIFPEAIAETRAEARAWRKALGLRVVTADELNTDSVPNMNNSISPTQKNFVLTKCTQLDLDVTKFLLHHTGESSFDNLSNDKGIELVKILNQYQTNTSESLDIPDTIKKVKNEG